MKNLALIFSLFLVTNCFSQSDNGIKYLDYANNQIEVPKNCIATSKYELLKCDGVSAQWIYLSQEMLAPTANQVIKDLSKDAKSKDPIVVKSFGATLKGYKLTYTDKAKWNRLIVFGKVNDQPLILNVASEDELIAIAGSNLFLKQIITLEE